MVRHGELLKRRNGTFEMAAKVLVGLPGFEPESIEPKSTSLDQASREPRRFAENIISTEP